MKDYFEYEGYIGSVNVSLEDRCLHGQIEFIRDVVTYEATTIEELEAAFKEAVDDYLATCAQEGKNPDKPFSGTFNVRVGPELHRELAVQARKTGTSLNDFIKQALEKSLSDDERPVVHVHKHEDDVTVHHVHEMTEPFVYDEEVYKHGVPIWNTRNQQFLTT
jgi:predicted HicB family RNase H-like nuclease